MVPDPSQYRLVQGAWIHSRARLPADPREIMLEPGALIGADVEVGPGNWLGTGAVIYGPTRIGSQNQVFPHAVLGAPPQDLSYRGQPTRLEIGDRNIFREGVTVHRASTKSSGVTLVGSDNFFMANSHVGHDCVIENHVILANAVLLGGHCHVGSHCNLAGGVAVVQFVTVGRFAFVCGTAGVRKDLEPFLSHDLRRKRGGSSEPQPACVNEVGLRRAGVHPEVSQKLKIAYKVIFLRKEALVSLAEASAEIQARGGLCPEVEELINFMDKKWKSRFGRARNP